MSLEKILGRLVELCKDAPKRKRKTRRRVWKLGPIELLWQRVHLGVVCLSIGKSRIELHRWPVPEKFYMGGKWWGELTDSANRGKRYGAWRLTFRTLTFWLHVTLPAKKRGDRAWHA